MGYTLVVLVLVLARPPGGDACIGPPSGLKCAPYPAWWGVEGDPWTASTTSGFCPMLTLYVLLSVAPRSLPPSYLPSISCPPVARHGSI